ncbi:hypothetical protein DRJ17_05705, partial [Candidatus Woesearchaeota archaeon]
MTVYVNIFLKNTTERETSILIETDLSESELQKKVDEIEEKMGSEDYDIYDVLDKLEEMGIISESQCDT